MEIKKIRTTVFSESCELELMSFSEKDKPTWKEAFDSWHKLKLRLRDYRSREPNLPEGVSEVAFCLWSGSLRFVGARGLSNKSFDTFNVQTMRAEQIKACSVEKDLTSFGPKSRWDDLYFLDFYNDGILDGRFDVYKIPTSLIYNFRVNKKQTLKDQQLQGRRPRLGIKQNIILPNNLKAVAGGVKVW